MPRTRGKHRLQFTGRYQLHAISINCSLSIMQHVIISLVSNPSDDVLFLLGEDQNGIIVDQYWHRIILVLIIICIL